MKEILYGYSELLIVAGLLIGLFIAVELGFLQGRRRQQAISDSVRSQINGVLASIVGLLALLLGFTFSLAIQRYEARNQAVVAETNAIGTTYLRTWLLPADMQEETRALLRRYVELLIQEGHVPLADTAARAPLQNQATRISNRIWAQAIKAAERDPRLLTSGLFIQTLNDQIDATAARNAELSRRVPEIVIWLIMAASMFATALLGFASGISGERASISAGILAVTLIMVFYLIITLDRPRSGPIRTNPQPVLSLVQSMRPEWAPLIRPAGQADSPKPAQE
jgi:ABC-type transport system involved in cytochrome c biogenesis permease subunit